MLKRALGTVKETWLYQHKWRFIFGTPLSMYGANWGWEYYNAKQYLSRVLKLVVTEGERPIGDTALKKVHIILNPVANGGYARQSYEQYAKPLLDCAGYHVTMHKTEYVKHERDIAAELTPADIIIIAGGDSTVQNVLTGLNRRSDFAEFKNIPIGIIPLGGTNTTWHEFSGQNPATWTNPYTRAMRIVESAQMIVDGHTSPVDVLALTNDDDKTIYTLTGLRWGKYYDVEERFPAYWYFPSEALKRRIAYSMCYLRGELDEMRSASISYANVLSQSESDENARRTEYARLRQSEMMTKVKRQTGFGRGMFSTAAPGGASTDESEHAHLTSLSLKLTELKNSLIRDFFEVNIKVNHQSADHEILFNFENGFNFKNFWKMITPFTDDPLSTRRLDFGKCADIETEQCLTADFTFEPQGGTEKFIGDEEHKDYSFYIDGESYIPCNLKGKLLVEHAKLFANKS